jgi:hypothetical protein
MFRTKELRANDIRAMLERVAQANASARRLSEEAFAALWDSRRMRLSVRRQISEWAGDEDFRQRYRQTMLSKTLEAAIDGTNADMGNIQLFEPNAGGLVIQVQCGFDEPFLGFFRCVESGHACCGLALQSRQRVVVEDVANSGIFAKSEVAEVLLNARVRAVQSTPLIGPSGQVLGVLSTHYRAPQRPTIDALQTIDRMARCAALVIEWPGGQDEPVEEILPGGI